MTYCTKCGRQNPDTAKFCTGCGLLLPGNTLQNDRNAVSAINNSHSVKTKLYIFTVIVLLIIAASIFFTFFYNKGETETPKEKGDSILQQTDRNLTSDSVIADKNIDHAYENRISDPSFLSCIYTGTIGNKKFTLKLEAISGNKVKGYNITNNNKRSVEGGFTESRGKYDQFGDGKVIIETYIYNLILKEPGTDEWDGEFRLRIELCDWFNKGEGTWKSYNGKLNRYVVFNDLELEKLISGE